VGSQEEVFDSNLQSGSGYQAALDAGMPEVERQVSLESLGLGASD
jgi:hypothetical protein